jgi:hypothetical protein
MQHIKWYVLIMIKFFLKWLKLVSLLIGSNERPTYAFLNMVFSRFGVPIKIHSDQGMEFHGEF